MEEGDGEAQRSRGKEMMQKASSLIALGVSIAFIVDGVLKTGSWEVAIAGIALLGAALAVLRGIRSGVLAAGWGIALGTLCLPIEALTIAQVPLQGWYLIWVCFAAISAIGLLITFFEPPVKSDPATKRTIRTPATWSAFLAIILSLPYLVDSIFSGKGWGAGIIGCALLLAAVAYLYASRGNMLSAVWGFLLGQLGAEVYSILETPPHMSPIYWLCLFSFTTIALFLSIYGISRTFVAKEEA